MILEVGQRVRVKSLGLKGTVEFVDYPHLFRDFMYPVQVILDNDTMYRTGLRDITKLKSKNAIKQEIARFLQWLDKEY